MERHTPYLAESIRGGGSVVSERAMIEPVGQLGRLTLCFQVFTHEPFDGLKIRGHLDLAR
jgi:hypothetical protein